MPGFPPSWQPGGHGPAPPAWLLGSSQGLLRDFQRWGSCRNPGKGLCSVIRAGKSRNSMKPLETALQEHPGGSWGCTGGLVSNSFCQKHGSTPRDHPTLPKQTWGHAKASLCPAVPLSASPLWATVVSRMMNLQGDAPTWHSQAVPTPSSSLFQQEFPHFGFLLQSGPEESLGRKKKNLELNQILSLDLNQMTLKEPKKSSKE